MKKQKLNKLSEGNPFYNEANWITKEVNYSSLKPGEIEDENHRILVTLKKI